VVVERHAVGMVTRAEWSMGTSNLEVNLMHAVTDATSIMHGCWYQHILMPSFKLYTYSC
jgi:hypothetical protein